MKLTKSDLYRLVESIVNKKLRMRKLNESEDVVSTSLLDKGFKIIYLRDPETLFAIGENLDDEDDEDEHLKRNFRIAKNLIKQNIGPLYFFTWDEGFSGGWDIEAILSFDSYENSIENLFHYADSEEPDTIQWFKDILNGKTGDLRKISKKEALQYVRDAQDDLLW